MDTGKPIGFQQVLLIYFSRLTFLNINSGTILSADYRCRFSLFGSAASKTFSRNVLTIHTYPWYEWFFFCTLKMPSERSDGIFYATGFRYLPQQALNFLPDPQMQGCFIAGCGTVGSIKYHCPPMLTKPDSS
ncbi:hypothetical protein BN1095_7430002 [Clostridioides difficile]|uniref:Uncharacterized protein n=1 Tax=Clostridioides difficile TaxID=1496 RepID=A0A069AZ57_CLODI|nr:hypothetical protein BN1095_7430002 [Clostridioides difficile]